MANALDNILKTGKDLGGKGLDFLKQVPMVSPEVGFLQILANAPKGLKQSYDQLSENAKVSMAATKAQLKKSKGGKLTKEEQSFIDKDRENTMNLVMASVNPASAEGKAAKAITEGLEGGVTKLVRRGGVAAGEKGAPGYLAPKKPVAAGEVPEFGFNNQATSPLDIPKAPNAPAVAATKERIIDKIPFLNNQKSVVRINLEPSVYGAGREKAVQQTVDTLVPGKSAVEKYTNLQPTMDRLGQQIQDTMAAKPKTAPIDKIMKNYDINLSKEGIYRSSDAQGSPAQKKDAIQKMAQNYVRDLYNAARGETSEVVPSNISDNALYELKQQINSDAKSVYKKIDNGASLTDKDRVILGARQTIDDTLSELHPEVKELTTKQSHLYDSADSLYKGREAELAAKANQPGLLGRVLKSPSLGAGLGVLGISQAGNGVQAVGSLATGGLAFLNNMRNPSGDQPEAENIPGSGQNETTNGKNDIQKENGVTVHNSGMVSQGNKSVNRYSFSNDPYAAGQLISQTDYTGQANALDTQIANAQATGNPVEMARLQGQRKVLDNNWASQQGLRDVWNNPNNGIGSTLTVAGGAYDKVKAADPAFFNALNEGYDKLMTESNGRYAQMAKYLQYLENATGTDFSKFKSKDALLSAIDASVDATKSKWDQLQTQYSGSPEIQSQPNQLRQVLQSQPSQPTARPSMPAGGFGSESLTGNGTLDKILSL